MGLCPGPGEEFSLDCSLRGKQSCWARGLKQGSLSAGYLESPSARCKCTGTDTLRQADWGLLGPGLRLSRSRTWLPGGSLSPSAGLWKPLLGHFQRPQTGNATSLAHSWCETLPNRSSREEKCPGDKLRSQVISTRLLWLLQLCGQPSPPLPVPGGRRLLCFPSLQPHQTHHPRFLKTMHTQGFLFCLVLLVSYPKPLLCLSLLPSHPASAHTLSF